MPPSPKRIEKGKGKGRKKEYEPAAPLEYVPPPPPMPGDEFAMPVREIVKPDNQLQLSEADLNEEIAKMLTANNPAAPRNVARYNMKERTYKFEPMVEQTIVHYTVGGWLLHNSGDEGKRQMDMDRMEAESNTKSQKEADFVHEKRGDEGDEPTDDTRQLRNQFNFSERAAQTVNFPLKDRETFTEPPPTATVSGWCTQWGIYDEYIQDLEKQRVEESLKTKGGKKQQQGGGGGGAQQPTSAPGSLPPASKEEASAMHSPQLATTAHIMDRMVNQNMYEEIAMDFKYWDDASDDFRPGEGSLLPLWKFGNDKARRRQVTSICWNPQYNDLFAVGYGSYDFLKQTSGLINVYSLKNPSHPEFVIATESGVMCLHFHPEHSNLLAVGCYDGSVSVYDIRKRQQVPIYQSSIRSGKHNEPVWNVFWQVDDAQKALQFVSISSDGCVNIWTLNKSELTHEFLMKLHKESSAGKGGDSGGGDFDDVAGDVGTLAGGSCLDFNKGPGQEHIYLVGTEEGSIHKCSKAYSSQYLSTYQAHSLAVYAVKWNNIHNKIFLSASADWMVKLWDANQPRKPVLTFDFSDAVGDIAWSPYSATVFAAITDDGKAHVFDLSQNKLLPLCAQKVVKKAKLTKIVFNPKWPIILVGDDKGVVTCLKLSPNLRRQAAPEPGKKETVEQLECGKLDQVIDVARRSDPESMQEQVAANAS